MWKMHVSVGTVQGVLLQFLVSIREEGRDTGFERRSHGYVEITQSVEYQSLEWNNWMR